MEECNTWLDVFDYYISFFEINYHHKLSKILKNICFLTSLCFASSTAFGLPYKSHAVRLVVSLVHRLHTYAVFGAFLQAFDGVTVLSDAGIASYVLMLHYVLWTCHI